MPSQAETSPAFQRVPESHSADGWQAATVGSNLHALLDAQGVCFGKLMMSRGDALAVAAAPELNGQVRALLDRFHAFGSDALDTPAGRSALAALQRAKGGGQRDIITVCLLGAQHRGEDVPAIDRGHGGWTILHQLTADPHFEVLDRRGATVAILQTTERIARIFASALELRSALYSLLAALSSVPGSVVSKGLIHQAHAILTRAGGAVQ